MCVCVCVCVKYKYHTTKWYMPKLESVQENETHKIYQDFEIQTDHQIPARRPGLELNLQEKKNMLSSGFCCSTGP